MALAALLVLAVSAGDSLRAQQASFEVALRDGRVLPAANLGGEGARVRITPLQGDPVEVALAEVLALHGSAVEASRLPAAFLGGGEVVRGLVVGGDSGGDTLELQSAVFGRWTVRVDRLACLVFGGLEPSLLELPDGSEEVLFQKAALGFDRLVGSVHQFGEGGVRFQPDGQKEPRWYPARDIAGLRLRGAEPSKLDADAEVLTRSGDRLRVRLTGWQNGKLLLKLEDGRDWPLALKDLGCVQMLGGGAVFVSDLTPREVKEASPDSDVLLPWRRDRSVTGSALAAGGFAHARGLGVHSQSRLSFEVPVGAAAFCTRVALDDSALALPVRGAVEVRVMAGTATLFEAKDLVAGAPPRATGLLPVKPGQLLTLEVDYGKGRDLGDRVDWLMPVFLPAPSGAR